MSDNPISWREIVSWMPVASLMLLMPSFLFPLPDIQRWTLTIGIVSWCVDYIVHRRWIGWHFSSGKWLYLMMILFFVITPLHQLWDIPPTHFYLKHVERRIPFLVVGIMGLAGFTDKLRVRHIAFAMLVSGIACLVVILAVQHSDGHLAMHDFLHWFNFTRHWTIASHMKFNLFMNLAVIMGFYTLQEHLPYASKTLIGIAMTVCVSMVLMSDGRIGIITTLIIVLAQGFNILHGRHNTIKAMLLLLIVAAGVVAIVKTNWRFEPEYVKHEPRIILWKYSIGQIRCHPIAGYGLSSLSNEFVRNAYYDPDVLQYYINSPVIQDLLQDYICVPVADGVSLDFNIIHPHNTFLEMALEHGIIGLLLLLALCISAVLIPIPRRARLCYALTLLSLLLQSMTEPINKHFHPLLICVAILVWDYGTRQDKESFGSQMAEQC